jgi:two-component system chemotaxis response regulator CheY
MRWTFLVVDSDAAGVEEARRLLTALGPGAEVLTAASGEAALALLEEQRVLPSLVLVEYELAGMNGIDLLGEVRHRRWLERVPVALVSRAAPDRVLVTAYRLGACAFLAKPLRAHELRETVRDFAHEASRMTAASVLPGGRGEARRSAA